MAVHLAKGMRDHLPDTQRRRLDVFATVREVFERFGFEPLDTPAMERIETLTGKYGDEGEKLMFRVLKRGEGGQRGEVDMALRYDLTVPLARVLAMHSELRMPFKRWQIAPVWRADRPQRGRFREFLQCDVDIAGVEGPMADAECLAVYDAALTALGFTDLRIRVNDRRILRAMARAAGAVDAEIPVLIAIDKLDKIGKDGVTAELKGIGLDDDGIARLWDILEVPAGLDDTLDALEPQLDDEGQAGVAALREVLPMALAMGVDPAHLVVDPTLARGLDYYTGPVFEVGLPAYDIGSVGGGGRYDDLVGMFSGKSIPCVGASIGIERLLLVMEEQGMLGTAGATAEAYVTVWGDATQAYALEVTRTLRDAGIRTEMHLEGRKLKAQLKHANARGYAVVVFAGPDEAAARQVTLRRFDDGSQETVSLDEAAQRIRTR